MVKCLIDRAQREQLKAALRITPSLTLSVRRAIIMILFKCRTTINAPYNYN